MNVKNILDMANIPHKEGGTTSRRAVGVPCPACGDNEYHAGVFKDGKSWSCFICKSGGSFYGYMRDQAGWTRRQFDEALADEMEGRASDLLRIRQEGDQEGTHQEYVYVKPPPAFEPVTEELVAEMPILRQFLEERRISVHTCLKYYAGFCLTGPMKLRLVVPVFWKGEAINYQGRDVTGRQEPKWLFHPGGVDQSRILYPEPVEDDYAIVVEGIFDQWRIGDGSYCLFGKNIHGLQLLRQAGVRDLIFAWDSDAYRQSLRAAKQAAPLFESVRALELPEGEDPDSLGQRAILERVIDTKPL